MRRYAFSRLLAFVTLHTRHFLLAALPFLRKSNTYNTTCMHSWRRESEESSLRPKPSACSCRPARARVRAVWWQEFCERFWPSYTYSLDLSLSPFDLFPRWRGGDLMSNQLFASCCLSKDIFDFGWVCHSSCCSSISVVACPKMTNELMFLLGRASIH
jgi:hypothetical protein